MFTRPHRSEHLKGNANAEDLAANIKQEGTRIAGQNRERLQHGMHAVQYGVTKFLSKGNRRDDMPEKVRAEF